MESKMKIEDALKITGDAFAHPELKLSQKEHIVLMEAYNTLKDFIETNTKKE